MDSSNIARFVNYFNNASISALALVAFFGIVAILSRKLRVNTFLAVFCVAALAAFVLEATVFNCPYYLRYFADSPVATAEVSKKDPSIIMMTDGTTAELIKDGIRFNNLNKKVTSLFADIAFNDNNIVEMLITWTDEGSTYQYAKSLYKYIPHENYAPLQPYGKVSDINIIFSGKSRIDLIGVTLNKPIPFYFSGLRLWVISFLFFALFSLVNKKLRDKAAYYFFEYKFDPKNQKQNIVYAGTVVLLVFFSWVCVYTSVPDNFKNDPQLLQYNKFLVDALIAGETHLSYGHPEKLFSVDRPYDAKSRIANGFYQGSDVAPLDWSWYNGKFYCYFGIAPAVLLYVPYKLITGSYLSNHAGVFLFGAISVILLALLWRHCVRKYMPNIGFTLYLLSFLTLFFTSNISATFRFPLVYSIVMNAGFMFTVAGILLLFKSVDGEKIDRLKLFFACLCLALVFGCRPNLWLASLLVPIVLWKHRSWKLLMFVMIPYILIAIPLCWYNYVRFESIFEFGQRYTLNGNATAAYHLHNPLSKLFRTFVASAHYLFYPNRFTLEFPFVRGLPFMVESVETGVVWTCLHTNALINYPIVFCLFYLIKNIFNKDKPKTFYILYAFLFIAATLLFFCSFAVGTVARYMLDFAAFIILPSLFCAYYWCCDNSAERGRLIVTYALMAVSIFVGLFMFMQSEWDINNPTLYRYLEYSLGII